MTYYLFELLELIHELVIKRESLFEVVVINQENVSEVMEDMQLLYSDMIFFTRPLENSSKTEFVFCKPEFQYIVKNLFKDQKEAHIDFCIWKIRNYSNDVLLKGMEQGSFKF